MNVSERATRGARELASERVELEVESTGTCTCSIYQEEYQEIVLYFTDIYICGQIYRLR
jgi:hypothetical protein